MTFDLGENRRAVIREPGHALVLGGPGAGKTTLAILKAQAHMASVKPGQTILFLSFSKAAVQQILSRCRGVLENDELRQIEVRTYHSFCWELLKAHGRALRGLPITMLTPASEGVRRTQFPGDWSVERLRLLDEESCAAFDMFAHAAARLVEESRHIRALIADRHPMIILDEFQDSDDDQWRLVKALSSVVTAVFLADPEQRIYDFRPGVRPQRLDILREAVALKETDLQSDNFRSPTSEIMRYANAVVSGTAPGQCNGVATNSYQPFPNMFNSTVHFAVGQAFSDLRRRGIANPSVAVLCSSNDLVADISELLADTHNFNGMALAPIHHDVVWDAELSAAAALVIASLLEQCAAAVPQLRIATLRRAADFWHLKKDWSEQRGGQGAKTAGDRAARMLAAARSLAAGKTIRAGGPRQLADYAVQNSGDAVADWRAARACLQGHDDLREIASQA